MIRNASGQKLLVIAYSEPAHTLKTGDAANITLQISKDGGAAAASDDVNPTELDATNLPGIYAFDLTQEETLCQKFLGVTVSSTTNVVIDPVILDTVSALERYNGGIWLNVTTGNDGTTVGVNGTIDNHVKTWEDAKALIEYTGLHKIYFEGTTPVLDRDIIGIEFIGIGADAVFRGNPVTGTYSLNNASFTNLRISGVFGDTDKANFINCIINGITIKNGNFNDCCFTNTNKVIDGGIWKCLVNCTSAKDDAFIDFQSPTLNTILSFQSIHSAKNFKFINMNTFARASISGYGTIYLEGSGGEAAVSGFIDLINNAGATIENSDINLSISNILNTPQTETYSVKGVPPTVYQGILEIIAELRSLAFSGKTQSIKKLDGVTEAYTNTIDSVEEPTSKIRAT